MHEGCIHEGFTHEGSIPPGLITYTMGSPTKNFSGSGMHFGDALALWSSSCYWHQLG